MPERASREAIGTPPYGLGDFRDDNMGFNAGDDDQADGDGLDEPLYPNFGDDEEDGVPENLLDDPGIEDTPAGVQPSLKSKPDLRAMTRDQQIDWIRRTLDEDPDAAIGGYMRDADYTQKNQRTAARERELDAREAALLAREAGHQAPERDRRGEVQPEEDEGFNVEEWVADFKRKKGRAPTEVDLTMHITRMEINKALTPIQRTTEQMIAETTRERVQRQYVKLVEEFPWAADRAVQKDIAQFLQRMNAPVTEGTVEQALFAVHGRRIMEERAQAAATGRQRRVDQRQETNVAPPRTASKGAEELELPATTDIDEIAERQLKEIRSNPKSPLRRLLRPGSDKRGS